MESLKEMIQDRGERQQEMQAKEDTADAPEVDGDSSRVDGASSSRLRILCLPARTEADEIAAMMLAQVLETTGCRVQAVSVTSLAGEMVDLVDQCTSRCDLPFRHTSRRGDACSLPLQAPPWSTSGSESGRGIVGRTRRPEQGQRAHWLWRHRGRDVGGRSRTDPPIRRRDRTRRTRVKTRRWVKTKRQDFSHRLRDEKSLVFWPHPLPRRINQTADLL